MRRKCRCKENYVWGGDTRNIMYYEIINNSKHPIDRIYNYHTFIDKDSKKAIGTFSKEYFEENFIDIQEERKKKIQNINNVTSK